MSLSIALSIAGITDKVSQKLYRRLLCKIMRAYGISVNGTPLWISPDVYVDRLGGVTLGDRCVISKGVRLLTHDFSMDRLAERRLGRSDEELVRLAPVEIGDQAFIGIDSIILPGVTVGAGAIVGAGSVVTKDVPPDTIVAGNPAIVVCDAEVHWNRNIAKFHWAPRRP